MADSEERFDADKIERLRKRKGVTVQEFCAEAGYNKATWYRIMSGKDPHPSTKRAFLAAYHRLRDG